MTSKQKYILRDLVAEYVDLKLYTIIWSSEIIVLQFQHQNKHFIKSA